MRDRKTQNRKARKQTMQACKMQNRKMRTKFTLKVELANAKYSEHHCFLYYLVPQCIDHSVVPIFPICIQRLVFSERELKFMFAICHQRPSSPAPTNHRMIFFMPTRK